MSHGQSVPGSWESGFDHGLDSATGALNDYLQPFSGPGFEPPPVPPKIGENASQPYYWGQGLTVEQLSVFNAIHMALIPKGPHQGKVLVWGGWHPVLLRASTSVDPLNRQWWCQAWSIIDPDTQSFLNFLLPLMPREILPPTATVETVATLFCSGHAWTQEGDLVVAGGGSGLMPVPAPVPLFGSQPMGAKFLFLFDPALPSQSFGASSSLYVGQTGGWLAPTFELLVDRFYPTVTLTQRLTRNGLNNEIVVIAGGSNPVGTPIHDYETYVVRGIGLPSPFLGQDPDPNTPSPVVLLGPHGPGSTTPGPDEELYEYPRLHVIGDNTLFKSGPKPLGAKVDQNALATQLPSGEFERAWDITVGRNQPGWQHERDDGASLLLSANGSDLVVRLGGAADLNGATDTAEVCIANSGTADWLNLGVMPGGPRQYANAVVLPDGAIVVIGGADLANPSPYVTTTAVFHASVGWLPSTAPTPTPRGYHATAVLLPDGRVFVGGGERLTAPTASQHDYDIYVPHYLQGNPLRPTIVSLTDTSDVPLPRDFTDSAFEMASGQQFRIRCTDFGPLDQLSRIVLIAPGSITHHSDMSARFVDVTGSLIGGSNATMQFQLPPGTGRLPRGFYMLFALNSGGVPSVAEWVKIV